MKVIHVLKKIEQIDEDVKELRKMEKSLQRNKSFTTPIYMTIEKQINNLLGDKVKILELVIANPPEAMAKEFDGEQPKEIVKPLKKNAKADKTVKTEKNDKTVKPEKKQAGKKKSENSAKGKEKANNTAAVIFPINDEPYEEMDEIPMLTQDMIDSRFDTMKKDAGEKKKEIKEERKPLLVNKDDDRDVKLLDIALTKGTLNKEEIEKERDKKRVRFFRDNFPGNEY